ncbi:MbtH family protein [Nocardiopsis sp. NPDC049922]|uniref:MbtH family protein n=1 Tax=Nocardiopsis sp. NPDC049922 TaxID=3155157 RepID=UPI0033F8A8A7
MSEPCEPTFRVVVNDEEQYSLWPAGREIPAGWHDEGTEGTEDECVAHIETVWVDMRPRSLRERVPEETR